MKAQAITVPVKVEVTPVVKGVVANVIERFVWTFVQAAIGSISVVAVTLAVTGADLGALRTIGLTALGAGVAGVLSLAKNLTAGMIVVQSAARATAEVVVPTAEVVPLPPAPAAQTETVDRRLEPTTKNPSITRRRAKPKP